MSGIERIDENYHVKMAGFEIDCNDGKGEPAACHHAGEFYATVKGDHTRAAQIYETNCKSKGYASSCFNIGRLHLIGRGVSQDDTLALDYFDRGCKGQVAPACYFQGILLYEGLKPPGTTFSRPKPKMTQVSRAELARIEAGGAPPAPRATPKAPEPVVEKTKAEIAEEKARHKVAFEKLALACGGGESQSCHFLGAHYINPTNKVDRDPVKARDYLALSCDRNHAPSCFQLAVLFNKGDTGVPKNPELFEKYRVKTEELVALAGGQLTGTRTG